VNTDLREAIIKASMSLTYDQLTARLKQITLFRVTGGISWER